MATEQQALLTMSEIAEYLKCTTRHVQNLMGRGLPYIQVSDRMVRFDMGQVNDWMTERAVNSSTPEGATTHG